MFEREVLAVGIELMMKGLHAHLFHQLDYPMRSPHKLNFCLDGLMGVDICQTTIINLAVFNKWLLESS